MRILVLGEERSDHDLYSENKTAKALRLAARRRTCGEKFSCLVKRKAHVFYSENSQV
jgi:hypothetical protein